MNGRRTSIKTPGTGSVARRAPRTARNGARKQIAAPRRRSDEDDVVSSAIRVICVDDHAVLIEGLKARFAIDGGIEVIGGLTTTSHLLDEVKRLRPDVILLDIEMPGPDAFEMADRLTRTHPDIRIIVLSAHIRDAYISAAFAAGVWAYFAKSDELHDITTGIYEVMRAKRGAFVLGPKVRERCQPLNEGGAAAAAFGKSGNETAVMRSGAPMTLLASLTPREAEILRLIGKGLSRNQIAEQLCRAVKTVDKHQGRMMTKLGIAARSDLMRFAIREGLAQA